MTVKLYRKSIKPESIGIITPYEKQVKHLRKLFDDADVEAPKIGTVEDFQGQEREIILISAVRSSKELIPSDVRHGLSFNKNKNVELQDIVYKEAAIDHNQDASGGRLNVFTIKDSATLMHWNNTPIYNTHLDITYGRDGFDGGFGPTPPPLPPHFARMPGFFQPLPRISYETSHIKARPSSPHLPLH
ncbi:protein Obscurin-like [Glossina fuscipes fuscipes]